MATKVLVNGKFVTRPGVYATTVSGVQNPPQNLPYGNILLIDDGIGNGFGGGAGINGQLTNGGSAVYSFTTIQDFQAFVKGGELWNLAKPLFNPSSTNPGISKIYYIRAATTVPASIAFVLTNGSFVIKTLDEGVNANGVLDASSNLSNGWAAKLLRVNIPTTVSTFVTTTTTPASAGVAQVNKVVVTNVNIGDVFTYTQAAITITKTANSTLPADLYAQFVTGINANLTLSPIVVAASSGAGLVITATTVNTAFSSTSTATPAPAQFQMNFYHGTYKGLDPMNNVPYDNVLSANATTQLVLQSPIVSAVADLITWFNTSSDFNTGFRLVTGSTATGNIVVGDLASYPSYNLATGGTESFGSADFDAAMTNVNNLDFTFFLGAQYGTSATGLNNTKIFSFIAPNGGSKYERFLWLGGGYDKTSFSSGSGSSAVAASYYNSDRVVVCHGGVKKVSRGLSGFNVYSQLYKAATLLGRLCGLEPQTPLTEKTIGIDGEVHALSDDEQETAEALGILYSFYDYELETFVAGEDVNTLLNNEFLVNEDDTSFNIAIKRITAYLNKSIVIAAKKRFYGGNTGPNRNTVSAEDVQAWLETYLLTKVASALVDNLILGFANIVVSTQQDNLFCNYGFYPNSEISKMIFTGTLLES